MFQCILPSNPQYCLGRSARTVWTNAFLFLYFSHLEIIVMLKWWNNKSYIFWFFERSLQLNNLTTCGWYDRVNYSINFWSFTFIRNIILSEKSCKYFEIKFVPLWKFFFFNSTFNLSYRKHLLQCWALLAVLLYLYRPAHSWCDVMSCMIIGGKKTSLLLETSAICWGIFHIAFCTIFTYTMKETLLGFIWL